MKTVAVLTDFGSPDPTYSLNIICEELLGMLIRAGYKPIGIVEEPFQPERVWKEVELRRIPTVRKSNNIEFYDGWEKSASAIRHALDVVLEGIDVVITHDLIYQCALLWHNLACRHYASQHPSVCWLNWVHSASPSPVWNNDDKRLEPVQVHFPNSKTVFPNSYDVPRVARNFRCEVDQVAVVPHPTDVCNYLGFQEITKKLVYEKDLLSADAILVYPIRLDRGKQVEYVIRTGAALKKIGRSVRVCAIDFHSTAGDKVDYRGELKILAVNLGLNSDECFFTSQFDPSLKVRCPREMVADLMQLCNVFVMPSRSETFSLITQEAGLCGAFLVLNRDFPAFMSIFGENAEYRQFSSNINALTGEDGTTDVKYDNIDDYFHGIALRIAYELDHNIILAQQKRIRQTRNPDYVFKKYVEPLFHFK